ncbi:hypothetical protein GGTG_00461 [Gaeumannomyces tritici R3-111a-1]|uniref:Uncharacterized protein n=1 Tax=Gaeumannomyces tritici (strain R3-111a-1) TaxID=644352 RepID=J3NGS2_GAET3|nr:hypothetical protein GGTG_00461 [Gaeumannomyces tritici R3-111a-1]EJT80462.1 hypothetical protein GGTG_00461 [Gaeumannomyces tritici R3-111a-1]
MAVMVLMFQALLALYFWLFVQAHFFVKALSNKLYNAIYYFHFIYFMLYKFANVIFPIINILKITHHY